MSDVPRHLGNYVLGPLIGRGGMSEVYAATHRFLHDEVAIKLLRWTLAGDPVAVAAFAGEAERTRAIRHPNVVEMRDFGNDGDAFYLVMERLHGETLAARLARGALDEVTARELGAAIADGVAAAHDRDIVHRDLKPGNIVLVGGVPKIVDFGIARYIGGGAPASTTTRIGTPAYMAPEQLAGGVIAPCVDVWALGIVLFEMVAGHVPFDTRGGKSPQLVERAPRVPAAVSTAYAVLVARCLEREPGRRPPAMQDIARALRDPVGEDRVTEDIGSLPSPSEPGAAPARIPHGRSRRGAAVAGVAAGLGGVLAIAWYLHASSQDATPAPPAPVAAPIVASIAPDGPDGRAARDAPLAPAIAATAAADAGVSPPDAPLRPSAPAVVAIEVRSSPGAADIAVAGKHLGKTPSTIAVVLPATIVVTRRGYRRAEIRAEHAGTFEVELAPLGSPPHHATKRAHPSRTRAGETLD